MLNSDQAEFWEEVAPTWVELEDLFEDVGAEPGRRAMARLELAGGERVLDLGCGTGTTSVELGSMVGAGGHVLGLDIASGMLDQARARVEKAGAGNVEFRLADVEVERLEPGCYDAAFSRFGVMFFTDPVAAFANVRRALRPGATLSFVCWQTVFENEWMLVPGMAAASVTGSLPPMPGPDEPGPFAFADTGKVERILGQAGFVDVDIVPHNDEVVGGEDYVPRIAELSTRVGAASEAIRQAEELRPQIVAAVTEALKEKVRDKELHLSRGILLVRASVPTD